ncbi:MAG: hypothetical protein IH956_01515 [Chloroflexi bacterium]|nr:hypothetical protein [Chloroflexota bacterium]
MAEQQSADQMDGEQSPARYQIDAREAEIRERSLPMLVASKRCYACRSADEEEPSQSSDARPYIKRIAQHCAETEDYLMEYTPLKEALFRVILARGNEPTTSEELSQVLKDRWAMTPNPRSISAEMIQKVLDHGGSYCIVRLPDPHTEEDSSSKKST